MRNSRLPIILVGILIIGAMSGEKIVGFYIDLLWFEAQKLDSVLWTILFAQWGYGIAAGLLFFLLTFGLLKGVFQKTEHLPVVLREDIRREVPLLHLLASNLRSLVILGPLVLSVLTALVVGQKWDVVMKFLNHTPFGQSDPIFGNDYAFYLFTVPLLHLVKTLLWWALIFIALGAGVIYFFKQSIYMSQRGIGLLPESRRTISVLAILAFLMAGFEFYLDRFDLLTDTSGVVAGVNYADDHGRLPVLNLLIFLSLLGAAVSALNIFASNFRRVLLVGVALGIVTLGGNFYPTILQRFVVDPNELIKETPYIENTIAATRLAYGIDRVETNELTGSASLSAESIEANKLTIENIRLWDQGPLLDTLGQIQEIRTYYQFNSVDNDRYTIQGKYRQTLLSPRELLSSSLPNRTWINEHLTFTHGYGVSVSPVNLVTPEGLPVLFIQDIPPRSAVDIQVTRPEIYFGELTNDHVFVNTDTKEFDYPEGEKNVYKNYEGQGGVQIGSFFTKVFLAARFKVMKILFSEDIGSESRVLMYRNITDRTKKVTPFLHLDQDPYLTITEAGRLVWIYDAYTLSDQFPYSQRLGRIGSRFNYIRNSVKILIDAYEGSIQYYVSDPSDPIIQTYQKIFPDLFRNLSEMPKDLQKHIRYPSDLFRIQTFIHATYHMTSPQVFYNKEDQWEVPQIDNQPMEPYYTIMKLPNKKSEEYILMLPFTPQGKSNLSAWMVARSDGEHYGKLVAYTFPKQKLVYGPTQIVARINQDAEISRQISLWDQRGSQVVQGTLLVIPIEESLIYVRPLYLKADAGRIPELKRVVVGYEDRIAMEPTLEKALQKIFTDLPSTSGSMEVSASSRSRPSPRANRLAPGLASGEKVVLSGEDYRRIRDYFNRAVESQKKLESTLSDYRNDLESLGDALNSAQALAPAPVPPAGKDSAVPAVE